MRRRIHRHAGSLILFALSSQFAAAREFAPPAWVPASVRAKLTGEGLSEAREIISIARLESEPDHGVHYRFFNALRTDVSAAKAIPILMKPELYRDSIPFVEIANWLGPERLSPTGPERDLDLAGGVFGFRAHSQVQVKKTAEDTVRVKIIGGNFLGMSGAMEIQDLPKAKRWTRVIVFQGEMREQNTGPLHSTPKFVLERGAEVVFSFSGTKMRNLIEAR